MILPNILAKRGKAELKMTYNPQLSIICVNVVSWAIGLIQRMPGIVYSPTNEHTNKKAIRTTSIATPTTPNEVSDDMPSVTVCWKWKNRDGVTRDRIEGQNWKTDSTT